MAAQGLEKRAGVGEGEWQDRDPRQRLDLRERKTLGIRRCPHTGRQGIAGIERHVHHRTPLGTPRPAVAPLRVGVAPEVAIVFRVRVEQTADGPVLGGDLGLDAAPGATVARDHDLAADVDAALLQLFIVLGHALVDVDQLAGHVPVDRVGVEDRELLVLLCRGGVPGQNRLGEARLERPGLEQLHEPFRRRREQDEERLDACLVPPGAKPLGDPFGVGLACGRADMVRPARQPLCPGTQVLGGELGVEALLERSLLCGRGRSEAQKWRSLCGRGRRRQDSGQQDGEDWQPTCRLCPLLQVDFGARAHIPSCSLVDRVPSLYGSV